MQSVLHQFLQSLAATIVLAFILEIGFTSHAAWTLAALETFHQNPFAVLTLSITKFLLLLLIFALTVLALVKYFIISPKFIRNLTTLSFLALGLGLLGLLKLTLGEFNPYTLGFLESNKRLVGAEALLYRNPVRVIDYSTMYSCPHGYFYFLILVFNLIGARSFSNPLRAGEAVVTRVISQIELKPPAKRRKSVHEDDLFIRQHTVQEPTQMGASKDQSFEKPDSLQEDKARNHIEPASFKLKNLNHDLSDSPEGTDSSKPQNNFDLYEKEFSEESAENLSDADSTSSNVKSSASVFFLERFEKLAKKGSLTRLLLRLKDNSLHLDTKRPRQVLFWTMYYQTYVKATSAISLLAAIVFLLSGNAFVTDLMFGFIFAKIFSRFYFRVLERSGFIKHSQGRDLTDNLKIRISVPFH